MKRFLFLSLLALASTLSQAKVTLPHLLGDHMILQQNTDARLWGKAAPNATVRVTVSWSSAVSTAKADAQGNWKTTVHTPKASFEELSITFDDGEKLTLHGVLSGEVWIAAGQSNREMTVKGYNMCPVEGYNDVVADAINNRGIHHVKIPSVIRSKPQEDADCHWEVVDNKTVQNTSATGYFFAHLVNRTLDIPVGIIEANKGGSRVEGWLNEENLKRYTDEPLDSVEIRQKYRTDMHYPLMWYNGTIHPVLNYTVGGIIFYQGCSNVGDPGNRYSERLALMVKQWREEFDCGEIPFYFVQIAPFIFSEPQKDENARLQEQQFRALSLIPNSGLVCTNDAVYPYEIAQIHPTQKRKVGERLAYLALSKTYGVEGFICESPSFSSVEFKDDKAYVILDNVFGGLNRADGMVGFELAGEDRVFHPAEGTLPLYGPGNRITLTSPEVPHPVAVRYCFRNFQLGNVANMGGLPLFPFRSDDWE